MDEAIVRTETRPDHSQVLCRDLTKLRPRTLVRVRLKNKNQGLFHTRSTPWKIRDRWYILLEGKVARYQLNDILAVIEEPAA